MAKELPISLRRISITREATTDFRLAPFPSLPDSVRARFPDLKNWEGRIEEWRRRTDGDLRRLSTDLREFRDDPVEEVAEVVVPPPRAPNWDEITGKPECFPACDLPSLTWSFTVNGV